MARVAPVRVRPVGGEDAFELTAPRLVVAGYTGRDADAVAAHIAELAAIGVAPPRRVPAFFHLDPALLTTDPLVEVTGSGTSGEVEPVLIRHTGRLYLGVGSDHTDRDAERVGVVRSKALCPKPLGADVLTLPSGLDDLDWDGATVEMEVDDTAYQHGRLSALRTPRDLFDHLVAADPAIADPGIDLVLFCGTVPLLHGQFVPGVRWRLTLTTAAGARLTHHYDVKRRST